MRDVHRDENSPTCNFLSVHSSYFSLCFYAARAMMLLQSTSSLHSAARILRNLAYAVPAGYISISSMTYSETRPNRLGWHGTVASRASERKCITSVRQMARIILHFNHFTRYKVSHSFSFFGLLLDFLLFAIRKLTEPLEATRRCPPVHTAFSAVTLSLPHSP